jgi:hypothetical protein
MDITQPRHLSEWLRRAVSLRGMVVLLILAGLLVSEMRFDWAERVLGDYLITTNSRRPESGAIWETGHQSETARQQLETIVADRQMSQREIRNAQSLSQLLASVTDEEGVMTTADHFLELYFKLPELLSQEIASPYTLLSAHADGNWTRTFFEKFDGQISLYLLDDQNRVLRQFTISAELLDHIQRGDVAISTILENLADFADRIYPADQFFRALEALPEEVRRGVVSQPLGLLRTHGKLVKVGISDEVQDGYIEIGFEFHDVQGPKVVLAQAREWDLWQLRTRLRAGRSALAAPVGGAP